MEMMYKAKVIRDASGMSNDISFSGRKEEVLIVRTV